MIKSSYSVIGVMSGTSLDGIDILYASYSINKHWTFKIHCAHTISYSKYWKFKLSQLTIMSKRELLIIDLDYSQYLGEIIRKFISENKIQNLDFVASHGHTALHQPKEGLTLQIGNQQALSDFLNLKVICDFRVQDVEYGGQGAPLVPVGDRLLFDEYDFCVNLGGFANISYEHKEERIAFDICPVNIVLNHYVSRLGLEYDDKGQLAREGKLNNELLIRLNNLDFYKKKPPKSLGLEWVQEYVFPLIDSFDLSIKDILRTSVEHIAIEIAKILNNCEANVLITGGGVFNDFLIRRLESMAKTKIIIPHNDIIEYKEALVFGLLGILKERNEINCLKSVTGASTDHSSGKILIPTI